MVTAVQVVSAYDRKVGGRAGLLPAFDHPPHPQHNQPRRAAGDRSRCHTGASSWWIRFFIDAPELSTDEAYKLGRPHLQFVDRAVGSQSWVSRPALRGQQNLGSQRCSHPGRPSRGRQRRGCSQ